MHPDDADFDPNDPDGTLEDIAEDYGDPDEWSEGPANVETTVYHTSEFKQSVQDLADAHGMSQSAMHRTLAEIGAMQLLNHEQRDDLNSQTANLLARRRQHHDRKVQNRQTFFKDRVKRVIKNRLESEASKESLQRAMASFKAQLDTDAKTGVLSQQEYDDKSRFLHREFNAAERRIEKRREKPPAGDDTRVPEQGDDYERCLKHGIECAIRAADARGDGLDRQALQNARQWAAEAADADFSPKGRDADALYALMRERAVEGDPTTGNMFGADETPLIQQVADTLDRDLSVAESMARDLAEKAEQIWPAESGRDRDAEGILESARDYNETPVPEDHHGIDPDTVDHDLTQSAMNDDTSPRPSADADGLGNGVRDDDEPRES